MTQKTALITGITGQDGAWASPNPSQGGGLRLLHIFIILTQ